MADQSILAIHRPQQEKEMRLNLGLQKLIQGAKDVAAMKIVLAEEQKKLEVATTETMKMLSSLEVSSAEARKEGDQARITATAVIYKSSHGVGLKLRSARSFL